jgi:fatty acid desaturase
MPLYFAIAVTLILAAVAFAVVSVWAFFIVIPVAIILIAYVLLARRSDDPHAGTIERARTEPSGTVHNAQPGAGTANERVGQG